MSQIIRVTGKTHLAGFTNADNPPAPERVAGHLALDFANTISFRGAGREVDHLASAAAVLSWIMESGIVETEVPRAIASGLERDANAASEFAANARAVRDVIFAAGSALAAGVMVPAQAATSLHQWGCRTLAASQFRLQPGEPLALAFGGTPESRLLGPIVWAAIDLLSHPLPYPVRQCPKDDCRWLFIDRTKNGSRRWCSMMTCGNRTKASRHRARS